MLFYTLPPTLKNIMNWFPQSAAWLLIVAGLMALTWLGYERKRKMGFIRSKKEDWEETEVSKFLRGLSYLGILIGILLIWAAVIGMLNGIAPSFKFAAVTKNDYDLLTSLSLIILGLAMFMKPINDLPWAGIIGLAAGVASGVLIALSIPPELMVYPNTKWIVLGIGIAIATIVGLALKFWIGSIQLVSKIFSYPPIALIIAVYCIVQGIMVLTLGYGLANIP